MVRKEEGAGRVPEALVERGLDTQGEVEGGQRQSRQAPPCRVEQGREVALWVVGHYQEVGGRGETCDGGGGVGDSPPCPQGRGDCDPRGEPSPQRGGGGVSNNVEPEGVEEQSHQGTVGGSVATAFVEECGAEMPLVGATPGGEACVGNCQGLSVEEHHPQIGGVSQDHC